MERQRVALAVIVLKLTALETAVADAPAEPVSVRSRRLCSRWSRCYQPIRALQPPRAIWQRSHQFRWRRVGRGGPRAVTRADLEAIVGREQARLGVVGCVAGHAHRRQREGGQLAEKRLRPEYKPAFYAWLATFDPAPQPERSAGAGVNDTLRDPTAGSRQRLDRQARGVRDRRARA